MEVVCGHLAQHMKEELQAHGLMEHKISTLTISGTLTVS
jgi:hypothetical protein